MLYGTIAADAGVEATLKVCRDSWSLTLVATANTATDAEAVTTVALLDDISHCIRCWS
jgi:hypothetical protein